MHTDKSLAWGAFALSTLLLTACGGGGTSSVPQNAAIEPSKLPTDNPTLTPTDKPTSKAVEDYRSYFLSLFSGKYQGYGFEAPGAPTETSLCSASLTPSMLSVFSTDMYLLPTTWQLTITQNTTEYWVVASPTFGDDTSGDLASMIWRADGQFEMAIMRKGDTESHVCQDDARILPSSLNAQVSLVREVGGLLAARRDSFPVGSCTTIAVGNFTKFNDVELPISILDGHIVRIGDYSFDMLADGEKSVQVVMRGDAPGALMFQGESNTKREFHMMFTQTDGLIDLQRISEDGTMLSCGKKVGG